MEVYPLHRNQEFTTACSDILNQQWPRSMGARLHSLSKSCDTLPVSLALVHVSNKEVVGFSKLSAVQGKQNSCLLESVIIRESDRGKGMGRVLMELTEKYAKGKGMKTVYLNTIDKEGFYAHLGYTNCKPVFSLGENAHRIPEAMLQRLMLESFPGDIVPSSNSNSCDDLKNANSSNCHKHKPPNPSPEIVSGLVSNHEDKSRSSSVTKCSSPLSDGSGTTPASSSSAPAPPAPPPPPPLPTPQATHQKPSNLSITRYDPNQVIWMKKEIS